MNRDTIGRFASKSKWTLAGVVFVAVYGFAFYSGYQGRPFIEEHILTLMETKVSYTAPKSAHEIAVEKDMESMEAKAQCRDFSEQRVSMIEAQKSVGEARVAYKRAIEAEMRIAERNTNSISDEGIMEAGMDLKSAADNFGTSTK